MSVALAGHAPATFEIKSANLPLVALLLKSCDLGLLAQEWATRFGDIPDFFDNDPLLIDLAPLQGEGEVDFAGLMALLQARRVQPVAVKGGSDAQMASALQAGLVAAPEAGVARTAPQPAAVEQPAPTPALPPEGREEAVEAIAPSALVIDKPLRSGQQVYARGRDLVVLAMVNPGAEVLADGHIHVDAPLRGKAIAGARGNGDARSFTLALDPELVSIAGVYRTSDTPLPKELLGKPAQIWLAGGADAGKLRMQPLQK
jgi:septum site-determining protein MinC